MVDVLYLVILFLAVKILAMNKDMKVEEYIATETGIDTTIYIFFLLMICKLILFLHKLELFNVYL